MNNQILEDYRIAYNIDTVIDLLSMKGAEVIRLQSRKYQVPGTCSLNRKFETSAVDVI